MPGRVCTLPVAEVGYGALWSTGICTLGELAARGRRILFKYVVPSRGQRAFWPGQERRVGYQGYRGQEQGITLGEGEFSEREGWCTGRHWSLGALGIHSCVRDSCK